MGGGGGGKGVSIPKPANISEYHTAHCTNLLLSMTKYTPEKKAFVGAIRKYMWNYYTDNHLRKPQ